MAKQGKLTFRLVLTLILFPLFLFQCSPVYAGEYPKYQVEVSKNYDGDTITLKDAIPLYITHIRVKGIDTPELNWLESKWRAFRDDYFYEGVRLFGRNSAKLITDGNQVILITPMED